MFRQSLTIALLTSALAAQAPVFDITGGPTLALDGLKKVTHSSLAYHLGGGMKWTWATTETPMRLGFTYHNMPGKDFGTIKSSLNAYQLHLDAYLGGGSPNYALKFGISVNRYTVNNQGTETWGPDPNNPNPFPFPVDYNTKPVSVFSVEDSKGIKLGLRFGADIMINQHWTAEVLFQVTELSGGSSKVQNHTLPDPYPPIPYTLSQPNNGPVNPAWIQLGARYTF